MKRALLLIFVAVQFSAAAQQLSGAVATDATAVNRPRHEIRPADESIDIKLISPSVYSVWLHTEGRELLEKKAEEIQQQTYTLNKQDKPCPNRGDMDSICSYIRSKNEDLVPNSDYYYRYQRTVYEASCVDYENESDEEISRKVRAMWELYGYNQKCGPMDTTSTGDPLKWAVHYKFNDFVEDAILTWNLDVNRLDPDGTLLDYVEIQINKSHGEIQDRLKYYQRLLIQTGAKRKSEL